MKEYNNTYKNIKELSQIARSTSVWVSTNDITELTSTEQTYLIRTMQNAIKDLNSLIDDFNDKGNPDKPE